MSKDIRSYFTNSSGDHKIKFNLTEKDHSQTKKRSRRILDSDEEDNDVIASKLQKKKQKEEVENLSSKLKKKTEVIIEVESFFGKTPVLQKKPKPLPATKHESNTSHVSSEIVSKKESKTKKKKVDKKKEASPVFECDDELEASLLQTDDECLVETVSTKIDKKHSSVSGEKKNADNNDNFRDNAINHIKDFKTPRKDSKNSKKTFLNENKDTTEGIITPGSKNKRKNAEAYQKYLHRSGPKNLGSKEIPKGSPTCLQGLTFVVTGILDSLERDEAVALIQKCGGCVTSQVSKKTTYIVVGEEPGESKLQKAEKFGTKKINEDELLHLIIEKSQSKYVRKDNFIEGTPDKKTPNYSKTEIKIKRPRYSDDHKTELDDLYSEISKQEEEKKSDTGSLYSEKFPLKTKVEVSSEINFSQGKVSAEEFKNVDPMLWVEKYKPKSTKAIVGQGGEKSNVKKLMHWLINWHKNHSNKENKKLSKPAPWAQNDDGAYYKAALLSGPPGIGKTTTIHLVCQELGLDIIEFNASDTRSKRLLQDDISELLSSKSLKGFVQEGEKSYSNQVLVMDEVDGMAGNEDRGGIQELIQLVRNTRVPIVGICNDRNHPKMRSLVNYCFDLRFQRPPVKQIKAAMMSVCFKENVNISGEALEELIVSANHDIRQVLHRLSLLTFADKTLSFEEAKKDGIDGKKPLNLGPWDIVRKVFSSSEQDKLSLNDKVDLFFQDYSLGPLFVQDAYLHVKPYKAKNSESEKLALISSAADSIALGDTIERIVRNRNAWSLLPVQAIFSTVLPGHNMCGHFQGKIEFPIWLGKNSKTRKFSRIIQELHTSLSTSITGDNKAVNLDYLPFLKDSVLRPLLEKGSEGVPEAVKFMLEYNLIREDFDHILELSSWPGIKDCFSNVESKVKAAFTRALNKECQTVSHASKRITKTLNDDYEEGEEDTINDENDSVDFDPMIKKGKTKKNFKDEISIKKTKNEASMKKAKNEPSKRGNRNKNKAKQ